MCVCVCVCVCACVCMCVCVRECVSLSLERIIAEYICTHLQIVVVYQATPLSPVSVIRAHVKYTRSNLHYGGRGLA